jgi:hypothetical protein
MGSDTFIMVALKCTENSTPDARALAICASMKAARHHRGIDDLAGLHLDAFLQHALLAVVAVQHDLQRAGLGQRR